MYGGSRDEALFIIFFSISSFSASLALPCVNMNKLTLL